MELIYEATNKLPPIAHSLWAALQDYLTSYSVSYGQASGVTTAVELNNRLLEVPFSELVINMYNT